MGTHAGSSDLVELNPRESDAVSGKIVSEGVEW